MIASNAVYASLRREKRNRGFISRITSLLAIEEPAQWLDWDETDSETESNRLRQQRQRSA